MNESPTKELIKAPEEKTPTEFPYSNEDKNRLADYHYFEQLFYGQHFEAFKIRIGDNDYNKAYAKIRYVMVNFAGMISKIVADMLFGEKIAISVEDKNQQAWLEDLMRENNLDILLYESALTSSYMGDALLKLRVNKRYESDKTSTVIFDTPSANLYFPHVDLFDVTGDPKVKELAWQFQQGEDTYLRREIHKIGTIENKFYKMKGNEIKEEVTPESLGLTIKPTDPTKIDRHMLIHIPNWKAGARWSGVSDYYDLDTLFYAVNNRMSKLDNVLDKHTDPILTVPPGVLDENGKVKKQDGRVIEIGEGEDGKPEYVVWDASLENAFKEVEKLIEFIYMVGEVSPDVLGLGKGQSDSGRALKFKLMRTLAKVNRKKRYYDRAIKEALYVAQLLAKAHGATAGGKPMPGTPVVPEIIWQDGLPVDEVEQMDLETKAIDAGVTSEVDAMMRIYGYDEDTAKKKAKLITEEKQAALPTMSLSTPFNKKPNQPIKENPPANK